VQLVGRRFKPSSNKSRFTKVTATPDQSAALKHWLIKQRSSTRWKKLSKLCLRISPLCAGCNRGAHNAHHVKRAAAFPTKFYDLANLCSLCSVCHSAVSQLERQKRYVESEALYEQIAIDIASNYFNNML